MGFVCSRTIAAGETVAAFGGWIVPGFLETMGADRQSRSSRSTRLYPVSDVTPEPGDMLNHSCEPNCGLLGQTLDGGDARHRTG